MPINTTKQSLEGAMLPSELWVQVISFLPRGDLSAALCTCKALSSLCQEAWKAACYRRWPLWAAVADGGDAEWRRVYELLELRESEQAILPDVEAIRKRQTVINERHRGILTEWLYEVSHEWSLDSGIVYEAIKILDYYLTHAVVESLGSFQLIGLACLRVAMRDFRPTSSAIAPSESSLQASRFAHISANTYTSEQVEEMTKAVSALVPSTLNKYPNAKMHLRSLWFRSVYHSNLLHQTEVHVYTLASFLLQLSLLDLPCCACAPSHLAAAAFSLSMTAFNKPAWPRALEAYGSYTLEELEPLCQKLANIQVDITASQLRRCWKMDHVAQDIEYTDAWKQAIAVFECPSSTLVTLLGKKETEAVAVVSVVPDAVEASPAQLVEEVIEVDDDTSSASTDSAIDGDIMLASGPMSPATGDESEVIDIEIIAAASLGVVEEESDEEEEEEHTMTVPMSLVKAPASHGVLVAPL